ncbi:MAG: mechanosensitive ion channel [Bacteroidaceae bacterium]|nr:mechanosensitive ion channel [Bacteroidaceae bacterium]
MKEKFLQVTDIETVLKHVFDWCVNAGGNLIGALLIFIIGRFVIKIIKKLVFSFMEKRKTDPSITGFVRSLLNITLNILLAVAIVNRLGIETTSFAALIASAGLAVGMALSGNLQNFAGGLIILILKPYKVGDFIESQTISGTVKEIQIFHTILTTPDNKLVYIPNGSLSSGTITNYNQNPTRRVEWIFSVEYGEDINKVEEIVKTTVEADKRILATPEPFFAVNALDSSSVNVIIRAWVNNADFWPVRFDMNRSIYEAFNKESINFPFPQITVHNKN